MKLAAIELDLGTVTMSCTTHEIATTLAALLREMQLVIPLLRPDEREVLRRIMSQESGTLTVEAVFPGFIRESEAHKTLRRFRAAQFIRPARTGRWSADEPIEVKPFARLMWDHVGETEIFGQAPARPAASPVDEPVPDEEPDATVVAEQPVGAWEDNDVLDLREFDDLQAAAEEELRSRA